MLNRLLLLFLSFAFIFLLSCHSDDNSYITLDGEAQGTTFHIVYEDESSRDFSIPVDSLFKLIDNSMSLWVRNSTISRINRNETGVRLDEHFINVLEEALDISKATQGALDITIGPLVNAWKIGSKNNTSLPDTIAIDSILAFTGYRNVSIENQMVIKKDPRVQIDFNAIAQGYTVDLICTFLANKDLTNYLVEVGGEVKAKGVNSRNKYWQIGIDKPVETSPDERQLQITIPLINKSLATSGSYRKYKEQDGKKFSHVISPTTGYPAQHNLLSVSVIADDCSTADGYATAFLVMGLEEAMSFATANKIPVYCIYVDEDGQFAVRATSDWPN